ncbi:helix-turn-helix domain-containing protein [Sphingobium sp. AN641]|uniref:helix-turn-helix domain-containing protein n=1 Tax=Sphingobium sp. AN641 TaxID=3133443 RepID=UPI0030C0C5A1
MAADGGGLDPDGASRSEAAKVAGVTLQIVRDWVLRFNEVGADGLVTRRAPGRASILNDEQRARLAAISGGIMGMWRQISGSVGSVLTIDPLAGYPWEHGPESDAATREIWNPAPFSAL